MIAQRALCEILSRRRGDAAVVVGPGKVSFDLFACAPTAPTLYQMELGYGAAICLGLALGDPTRRAIAFEGDGSMLAGLATFTTIGRYQPRNLVVLVADNECYGAIQDPRVAAFASATGAGTDLAAVARGCGIANVATVTTEPEADALLDRALVEPGPWVIVAKTAPPPSDRPIPEPDQPHERNHTHIPDVFDNAIDFARELRRRWGR